MRQCALTERDASTAIDPRYVQGGRPSEVWAHFRSGTVLEVSRERVRHYPGLSGAAPATLGLYLRGDGLGLSASHVIDAGCGAGEGLRHLSLSYRRATGIDRDSKALAFARQLSPGNRTVQADLSSEALPPVDSAQLAYVVDVLGQLEQPERALWNLGQRLDGARGLLVAEAAATADQCLMPPVRRAFSMRSLHSVLVRGGFVVERWLENGAPFLICHAVAHRDAAACMLLEAEAEFARGSIRSAEELARHASQSGLPALRLEALLALARIQIELSRRDIATAVLLEARMIDPTDARPPAALSRLAELAGSETEAHALAKEAVRLDLTEIAAVTAMAQLSHDGEPQRAMDSWLVAHALAPDHCGIAARLCEAALRAGECGVAITVLERLRHYDTSKHDSARSSLAMAWLLARDGRKVQAEVEARVSESLAPGSPEIKSLREFLKS
jgi:SAM-dependent methyltransferase